MQLSRPRMAAVVFRSATEVEAAASRSQVAVLCTVVSVVWWWMASMEMKLASVERTDAVSATHTRAATIRVGLRRIRGRGRTQEGSCNPSPDRFAC